VDSYAETAKAKGFHVEHDFATAAGVADGEHGFLIHQPPAHSIVQYYLS
jgi:hypothetical protein